MVSRTFLASILFIRIGTTSYHLWIEHPTYMLQNPMKFYSFLLLGFFVAFLMYTRSSTRFSNASASQAESHQEQAQKPLDTEARDRLQRAYTLNQPDLVLKLKSTLKEISGLTFIDEQHLAVVQDEKGKIYQLDIATGEIVGDERFDKDGDYEGIEFVDGEMYVLRSDGDVYRVDGWPPESDDAKKYETRLECQIRHGRPGLRSDQQRATDCLQGIRRR